MIGMTLCSGIGAPEMAAPWVDWRVASEIEKFPRAVLQERFGYKTPSAHNQGDPLLWGDMTEVTPDLLREHGIPLPEIIAAGTPCQAFSIAGLRGGTNDERGNLTLKFVETCHATVDARPDGRRAVLWENVPGVLSDKGNAFGCFLGGIVGADDAMRTPDGESWPSAGMVAGPRARAAWRVLDAQYFGVAQRRRRVFVVVDFGGRLDPAAVLFEQKSLRGHTPPSREAREGIAASLTASAGGCSGKDKPEGRVIAARMTAIGEYADDDTASSLKARDYKDATDLVAHALRGEGYDASEDGTGRGTPIVPVAGTLCRDSFTGGASGRPEGAAAGHFVPIAFPAEMSGTQVAAPGPVPPSLSVTHTTAIAFQDRFRGDDGRGYDRPPPTSTEVTGSLETVKPWNVAQAVAFDLRGREGGAMPEGPHDTANIRAASGGSSRSYIAQPWAVRRLTPTECARLQGFPDNHTAITYRGKPAADGPQYKALGNSMAVPCIAWIMDRMRESMENHQRRAA